MSIQQTTPKTSGAIDPVHLHAQAVNAINRIQRELLCEHSDHDLIAQQLYRATNALETLRIVDAHLTH